MKKFLITSIILLSSINVFSCLFYSDYWPTYKYSHHDYFWLCINFRERPTDKLYKYKDLYIDKSESKKNNIYSEFWDNYIQLKDNESLKEALVRTKDTEALKYLFFLDCYINCYDDIDFYQDPYNYDNNYYYENNNENQEEKEVVEEKIEEKEKSVFMIDIDKDDPWYYPTKEELIKRYSNLSIILENCQKNKEGKFFDRYTYLILRLQNAREEYQNAVEEWENSQDKISKQSDVYQKCLGFYARALYQLKQYDKAAVIYASIGDINSLSWCISSKEFENWDEICKKAYQYDNNAILLPYILDRITNNSTSLDFANFAEKCSQNSQLDNAQMWANASAYINIQNKKYDKAKQLLDKSEKLKGDNVTKDNLRFLKLYLSTFIQKNTPEYIDYLTKELKWLEINCPSLLNKICVDRISKFFRENNNNLLSTLVMMYSHIEENYNYENAYNDQTHKYNFANTAIDLQKQFYEVEITTMSIDSTIMLRDYISNLKNGNSLEKYIGSLIQNSDKIFNELIGTKYIRANDFSKAIEYLKLSDGIKMNIDQYLPIKKLDFAIQMQNYLKEFENASDDQKCEIAYKIGENYFLAADQNNGWALRNYVWSSGQGDLFWNRKTLKTDKNYLELAENMLEIASNSTKAETRINALWLLAQVYFDGDIFYQDKNDYSYHYNKTHMYYLTMKKLAKEFETQKVPKHISKCDFLVDFLN